MGFKNLGELRLLNCVYLFVCELYSLLDLYIIEVHARTRGDMGVPSLGFAALFSSAGSLIVTALFLFLTCMQDTQLYGTCQPLS